jgi:hypothetical protein
VAEVDAEIFHYGWVRPPGVMQNKIKVFSMNHRGKEKVEKQIAEHKFDNLFDYGNLSCLTRFNGTHPAVMKEWIKGFHWMDQLRFTGPAKSLNPLRSKHDKPRYRLISWIEKYVLAGSRLGEFKNYTLLDR